MWIDLILKGVLLGGLIFAAFVLFAMIIVVLANDFWGGQR